MKKLKLNQLTIRSFKTADSKLIKGGYSDANTECGTNTYNIYLCNHH